MKRFIKDFSFNSKVDSLMASLFNIKNFSVSIILSIIIINISNVSWITYLALHVLSASAIFLIFYMTIGLGFVDVIKSLKALLKQKG